jgi:hypothetical protein
VQPEPERDAAPAPNLMFKIERLRKSSVAEPHQNPGKNVDATPEPPEPHQNFNPKSEPGAA